MKIPPCKNLLSIFIIILGGVFLFLIFPGKLIADDDLPTSVSIMLVCGDGFAEQISGEVCDPGDPPEIVQDIGTSTCADYNDFFGHPYTSGQLGCLSTCTDYDNSPCYTCGNTIKEFSEQCDSADFGGGTCITWGYDSGTLLCSASCMLNFSNCVARETQGGSPGSGRSGGSAGSPTGYLPGETEQTETKVIMKGKSYPDSDVHILVDGKVTGIVTSDAKADFYFETTEVEPGIASFGFWSEDKLGLKSTLLTLTFRVISRAVTTISGVYIAPSIEIDKKSVKQGEIVKIYGQTVPDTQVNVHINSAKEFIEKINSKTTGDWEVSFNTAPLEEDFHIAKALFQMGTSTNIIQSGFSRSVSFAVGKVGGSPACPNGDLNKDGRVNLTDFSIMMYYWGTDNECADQNQNGVVDLVDFSIMMYYWTG